MRPEQIIELSDTKVTYIIKIGARKWKNVRSGKEGITHYVIIPAEIVSKLGLDKGRKVKVTIEIV